MKIRSTALNWMLAQAVVFLCRALFRTLRIRCTEADARTNPYTGDGDAVIYCVWHDAVTYPLFAGRHHRTVALISKHQDRQPFGLGLKMLGIDLVWGSSSRAGASAVRELLSLPENKHIVLTPDGPRGPRRRTKLGMVYLASQTGRAIVPTAFAPVRAWNIPGNWTNLSIPKPFTTVYIMTGAPIFVPRDLPRTELVAIEQRVQSEMDRLAAVVEQQANPQQPPDTAARAA